MPAVSVQKQWSKEHLEKIILSNKDVCWSEFVEIK